MLLSGSEHSLVSDQSTWAEIKELKESSSALRDELVNLKFSKKEAIQKAVLNSSDEIRQLKSSTQSLRDELEEVISNYEKKLNNK